MKLNHLNLTVTDVRAAADFLVKYFGLVNQGGNAGMTVLTDTDSFEGMVLTLMKARASTFRGYPDSFHIGFSIQDNDAVDQVYRNLVAGGFEVDEPADTGHSYGFYVDAPGGFTVEIGA